MSAPMQRWTGATPWEVCVSPLDDPAMPLVADYERREDAERVVLEHNELCVGYREVEP